MLAGEYYNPLDEELLREREFAKNLIFELNMTSPNEKEKRQSILRQLIQAKIIPDRTFYCDYGYNIEVGDNFFANYGCIILDCNKVIIGDNVLLGPNVQIYTAAHPTNAKERLRGMEYAKPIVIGNNVWIGGGAIICPGVTIGDNVTIGAGSVVTKDIPANVIGAGNPCRIVREIVNS